jgi:NitT/TauT family transport system permease protein
MTRIIPPILAVITAVLIWQLIALRVGNPELLPDPQTVYRAGLELLSTPMLSEHIFSSLFRVFTGYFIGVSIAIPLGLILGWYKVLRAAAKPLVEVIRTISPIAWVPLAILWFGIGSPPAIFIIAVATFFPVLIATYNARDSIDSALIKVATNLGATDFQLLSRVVLPASLPFIFVGLKISLGLAWVVIVAAEMVGMRSGLGFLILDSRNMLRVDLVIAVMIAIGIIGLVLDSAMSAIQRQIFGRFYAGK